MTPHVLVITRIPADEEYEEEVEYELIHPAGCPKERHECDHVFCIGDDHENHWYEHYTCGCGVEIDCVGLDGLECTDFIDREAYDAASALDKYWEWKFLPAGRYEVEFWAEKIGTEFGGAPYEYESGLTILRCLPSNRAEAVTEILKTGFTTPAILAVALAFPLPGEIEELLQVCKRVDLLSDYADEICGYLTAWHCESSVLQSSQSTKET